MTACTEGWQCDGAVTAGVNYQGFGDKGTFLTGSEGDYIISATVIFSHRYQSQGWCQPSAAQGIVIDILAEVFLGKARVAFVPG